MIAKIEYVKFAGGKWTQQFDIDYLCENLGKKEKDKYDGTTYTVITKTHIKKIFKLIKRYHDNPDEIGEYIKEHYPKAYEVWEKVKL